MYRCEVCEQECTIEAIELDTSANLIKKDMLMINKTFSERWQNIEEKNDLLPIWDLIKMK